MMSFDHHEFKRQILLAREWREREHKAVCHKAVCHLLDDQFTRSADARLKKKILESEVSVLNVVLAALDSAISDLPNDPGRRG